MATQIIASSPTEADAVPIDVVATETATEAAQLWTTEDIDAMTKTLAGECYDNRPEDKRRVCEVILNRVSSEGFPNTVIGVVSAKNQFNGYWRQSRPISENDYAVAEQALRDWYENGCQPLSEWLFFVSGKNNENVFRKEYN